MTNFNLFSESAGQKSNNFQALNINSLQLHNGQELKRAENKTLPGSSTQFQSQSQVKIVSLSTHSLFNKAPVQKQLKVFPLLLQSQRFRTSNAFSGAKTRATIPTFLSNFQSITSIIK